MTVVTPISKVRLWWQSVTGGAWLNLEFTDADIKPVYNTPARKLPDRHGVIKRILSPTLAQKKRWVVGAMLEARSVDILKATTLTVAIDSADISDNAIFLDNGQDYTALFPVGREIVISGSTSNDGTYTVAAVTQAVGNTTQLTLTQPLTSAGGTMGNCLNYFALPDILDFWVAGAYSATAPLSDTLFYLYHYEDGLDGNNKSAYKRKAYKGYLDELSSDIMGQWAFNDENEPVVALAFHIVEDGSFSTFTTSPASGYTANPTARPT